MNHFSVPDNSPARHHLPPRASPMLAGSSKSICAATGKRGKLIQGSGAGLAETPVSVRILPACWRQSAYFRTRRVSTRFGRASRSPASCQRIPIRRLARYMPSHIAIVVSTLVSQPLFITLCLTSRLSLHPSHSLNCKSQGCPSLRHSIRASAEP